MIAARWSPVMLGLTLILILGCKRQETPPPSKPGGEPGPPPPGILPPMPAPPFVLEEKEPHAAGKKVFNAHGCVRCHQMGEDPGGPPMPGMPKLPDKGPSLAKVGARAGRNVDWFIAFVSDPKETNPDSKMPPFGKMIKPDDMRALAEFLADLK